MTDISELIERVKAATGPDRELDEALRVHFRYPPKPWNYTASIDAALALVERCLPGHWQRLLDEAMAEVVRRSFETDSDPKLNELPLAILAALLTALQSTHSGQMK